MSSSTTNRRDGWRLAVWVVAVAALLLAGSARHALAEPHIIGPDIPHPFDPDWPDVYWILATKCIGCHRPTTDRTDYSSHASLIAAKHQNGRPVVAPGRPQDSLLWQYVVWNVQAQVETDLPDAPLMPLDKLQWLSDGQLRILHRWISNGAHEYRFPDGEHLPRKLLEIDFPSARQCAACHPKQFEEWSRSPHAYGQHSPVFEAFNLTLIERTSGTIGTFCTRCHTNLGTLLGENGSRRNVNRSRLSMEGVSCVVCHRRKNGHYKASSRVEISPGKLLDACVYGPFEDAHSAEVGGHQSVGKPYIRTSQFCGECHDVTSPQGIRLEEAFAEYHNSPAAKQGITCQMCHMGPVQGLPIPECERPLGRAAVVPGVPPERLPLRRLSDHTFAGPDYSLLPDTEFPLKLDWMYEVDYRDPSRLTPYQCKSLEELRRRNRAQLRRYDEQRYEVLRNAARLRVTCPETARVGEKVKLHVDVESIFAGHSLPTGFTAERQAWVSVEVRDPAGHLVFVSGDLDPNQDLRDEHSFGVVSNKQPFDKYLLNFQNKFIAQSYKGTDRSVVVSVNRSLDPLSLTRPANGISASFGRPPGFRIAKGSLPPLKTMGQGYPVTLPDQPGPYFVHVRLNFRHLPPTLLDAVGTPHLKHLLEVVLLDQFQTVINVTGK